MRLLAAFLRLIRWPNLVFIALTQAFFYYCIIVPLFDRYSSIPVLNASYCWWLIAASICIAAAGYIINDYFDLHIDAVNKPAKIIIDRNIRRRWAIVWHWVLSATGMLIGCWVSYRIHSFFAVICAFINIISVAALWLYSTTYKKKLLIGNILISLLTAWTIIILYLALLRTPGIMQSVPAAVQLYDLATTKLFRFAMLYAGFAFAISLVREVVKDMEDMEGDARYGCKTMPIEWGVPASKVFVAVWLIVLVALLTVIQFYALQVGWWWSAAYCIMLIILPLLWILNRLYKAKIPADYHRLSTVIKLVMLTGICSMIFFKLYA